MKGLKKGVSERGEPADVRKKRGTPHAASLLSRVLQVDGLAESAQFADGSVPHGVVDLIAAHVITTPFNVESVGH